MYKNLEKLIFLLGVKNWRTREGLKLDGFWKIKFLGAAAVTFLGFFGTLWPEFDIFEENKIV